VPVAQWRTDAGRTGLEQRGIGIHEYLVRAGAALCVQLDATGWKIHPRHHRALFPAKTEVTEEVGRIVQLHTGIHALKNCLVHFMRVGERTLAETNDVGVPQGENRT